MKRFSSLARRSTKKLSLLASAVLLASSIGGMADAAVINSTWNVDAAGNWTLGTNWTGSNVPGTGTNSPTGSGDTANLTNNISANRIVTLDANETIGFLNLGDSNNTNKFTLSGANTLTMDNTANSAAAGITQVATSNGDTISVIVKLASDLNVTNNSANGLTINTGAWNAVSGSKILTFRNALAGTTTVGNTTVIGNGGGTVGVTINSLFGAGNVIFQGAETYTGTTNIKGGTLQVTGSLATTTPVTFSGTGGLNINEAAAASQTLGQLSFTAGDGTVTNTFTATSAVLTFSDVAARTAGATGNFVASGGTNGTTNRILLTNFSGATTPTGTLLDPGMFFGGSSYASYDVGGWVRGYTTGDTSYVGAGAGASFGGTTSASNVRVTGNITAQAANTQINTLHIAGNFSVAMIGSSLLTNSILKSGNGTGSVTVGTVKPATANGELIIRTDVLGDNLTLTGLAVNGTSNVLTKTGLGTLTLTGAGTLAGAVNINQGVISVGNATSLSTSAIKVYGGGALEIGGIAANLTNNLTIAGHGPTGAGTPAALLFNSSKTVAGNITLTDNASIATKNSAGTGFTIQTGTIDLNGYTLWFGNPTNSNNVMAASTVSSNIISTGGGGAVIHNDVQSSGNRALTLSGNNSFTGGLTISSGTIKVGAVGSGSNGPLGATTNPVVVASGGALDLAGFTLVTSNPLTIAGTGNGLAGTAPLENTTGSAGYSGLVTLSANATIVGAGTLNLTNTGTITGSTFTLTLDGAVGGTISSIIGTGSGGVTKTGAGTWTLNGLSTYTGVTTIQQGQLNVASLNKVVGGSASSNLGAPTTGANGTIAMGANAAAILNYTGGGETTDRVINLAGTTTGATLTQAGTGNLKFTTAFTATGAGSKTLTLNGSTVGTGEIAAAIIDNSGTNKTSVLKSGTGIWVLSGVNSYTGTTSVSQGTLRINGSLNAGSAVSVSAAATIGGSGTINGTLGTVATAHIAPGNSIGVLTAGATTLASGTILDYEYGTPTGSSATSLSDYLAVTGNLTLPAGTGVITLNLADNANANAQGSIGEGVYRLFTYTGTLTNFTGGSGTIGANLGTISIASSPLIPTALYTIASTAPSNGEITLTVQLSYTSWTGQINGIDTNPDSVWSTTSTNKIFAYGISASGATAVDFTNGTAVKFEDTNRVGAGSAITNYSVTADSVTPGLVTFNSTGSYIVGSVGTGIAGAAGIVKQNSGTTTLTGANTFTSTVSITAGTLAITNASALGSSTGMTVASGAEFQISGGIATTNAVPVTITGAGIGGSQGAIHSTSGANTYSGAVTLGGNATIKVESTSSGSLALSGNVSVGASTLTINGAGNASIGGTISGTGGLTYGGAGTLSLGGTHSNFLGLTTVSTGTLKLTAATTFGNTGAGTAGAALNLASGSTLDMQDGVLGDFVLNQQASFVASNTVLTLAGASIKLDLDTATTTFDKITALGGKAVVSGTNTIYLNKIADVALSFGTKDILVVNATGGITSNFQFDNASTTKNIVSGGNNYGLVLGVTGNKLQITIGNAIDVWDSGSGVDDNWTSPQNWVGDVAPVANDKLAFGTGARTSPSNDFAPGTQFNGLIFNGGSATFTLIGNGIKLGGDVVNNSSNVQNVNIDLELQQPTAINASADVSVGGVISGAFQLTKTGTGTLFLTNTNTFSGGLQISSGKLSIGTINDASTNGVLGNNTGVTIGAAASTGTLQYTGANAVSNMPITIPSTGVAAIEVTTNTLELSGVIGGAGSLSKTGAGTLTLSGANTFSNGVNLSLGQLNINNQGSGPTNSALGTGTFTIGSGTTIDNTSGGTVALATNNVQNWGGNFTVVGSNDLNMGNGAVTMGGNRQVTVNGGNFTVGGNIAGGTNTLTKAGAGKLSLSGTNTYGSSTINGGSLAVNSDAALGTAPSSATNNITFSGNGKLITSTSFGINANRTVVINSGVTGTIDTAGNNSSVGLVSGGSATAFSKAGAGTLTMVTPNTYGGATLITGGTLKLGGAAPSVLSTAAINLDATGLSTGTLTSWTNIGTAGGAFVNTGSGITGAVTAPSTVINGVNGYSAVSFNGNALGMTGAYTNTGTGISIFLVESGPNPTGTGYPGELSFARAAAHNNDWDTSGNIALEGDAGGTAMRLVTSGAPTNVVGANLLRPASNTPSVWGMFATVNAGATSAMQLMTATGSASASGTAANANFNINEVLLGGRFNGGITSGNWQGKIGQVLVFNTNLSATDRASIMNYLNNKWVANILPTATALQIASGSALDLNDHNQTVESINDVSGAGGLITNSATHGVTITSAPTGSATFSGVIENGSGVTGLTINGVGTQTLAGTNTYTGATLVSAGKLAEGSTGSISNTSGLTVSGPTAIFDLGSNHNDSLAAVSLVNGSLTGSGTSTLTSASAFDVRQGSVTLKLAGGIGLNKTTANTVTISTDAGYTGITNISGGTLALSSAVSNNTIGASSKILVGSGAFLNVTGISTAGGFIVPSGQILAGFGTVTGNTTVQGSLAPGNSIGTLSITGDVSLAGTSDFEITGNASSNTYDKTIATGALNYGGTLNVAVLTTAPSAAGIYKLFTFGSQSGDFSSVVLPSLVSGLQWHDYGTSDFFNNATGEIQVELSITPANLVLTPANGTSRAVGQTVQIANTANLPSSDSLTVSALNISGNYNGNFTAAGISNGTIGSGSSQTGTIAVAAGSTTNRLNGAKISGSLNFNVAGTTISNTGDTGGAKAYPLTGAVSGNTVAVAGNGTTLGTAQTALVVSGDTLADLSTTESDSMGTTLTLRDSTVLGADSTVTVRWRERSANEVFPTNSTPPLPIDIKGLISDVAEITMTVAPSVYVVQMSYNDTSIGDGINEVNLFNAGQLYLARMTGEVYGADTGNGQAEDSWRNATLDTTNPQSAGFLRGYLAGDLATIGTWGVDTTNNVAWAVVDGSVQGQFGVVPEPASLGLLAIGAMGLLTRRRR